VEGNISSLNNLKVPEHEIFYGGFFAS
jgi:hypothetical protein